MKDNSNLLGNGEGFLESDDNDVGFGLFDESDDNDVGFDLFDEKRKSDREKMKFFE